MIVPRIPKDSNQEELTLVRSLKGKPVHAARSRGPAAAYFPGIIVSWVINKEGRYTSVTTKVDQFIK